MNSIFSWLKENTTEPFSGYIKTTEGAWVTPTPLPGHENNFVWNGTTLGESVQRRYSTTAWETDFLEQLLPSLLPLHNLDTDIPLIDLGCGDGRVTYLLHRIGFNKLIGIDLDEMNIRNAASQTPTSSLDNIFFMMGDALHLPFKYNTVKQIFISSLPFLPTIFSYLKPLIKKRGRILYLTFTLLEAALTYALLRGDWKEFIHIMATQSRAACWEDKNIRYPVTITEEIIDAAQQAGFFLETCYGIPIFASLVFGALCQEQTLNDEDKELLYNKLHTIASMSKNFVRQHLLIFQKE